MTALVILASPSKRSRKRWIRLSAILLSWDSSCAPPPTCPARVHSGRPKPPSDRRCHPPVAFRPRGFTPPRRFAPRNELRVCCTPLPAKGSPRFVSAASHVARGRQEVVGTVPATRFTPFEEFPSSAAVPHHCGRCLLGVTAHRSTAGSGRSRSLRSTAPGRSRSRNPRAWLPRETVVWDAGRTCNAVMLRSAEADPHVTGARLPATDRSRTP
jgi:hypothetical protein